MNTQNTPEFQTALELMSDEVFDIFCLSLYKFAQGYNSLDIFFDYLFSEQLFLENKQKIKNIIKKYEITRLSNGNSKVIAFKKKEGSEEGIIKIVLKKFTNKGNPEALQILIKEGIEGAKILKPYMAKDFSVKKSTQANHEKKVCGSLLLTPKAGNDLRSYFSQIPNKWTNDHIKEAVSIYLKMATALESMTKKEVFFPDLKNSNWQYVKVQKDNSIQEELVFADTKSFVKIPADPTKLILTREYFPPEIIKLIDAARKSCQKIPAASSTEIEEVKPMIAGDIAEKFHVYGLGVNMIKTLSGQLPPYGLKKIPYPLCEILEKCIDTDPSIRPTLSDMCKELKKLQDPKFPYIHNLGLKTIIAGTPDNEFIQYIALNQGSTDTSELAKLTEAQHLQAFYTIVSALYKKQGGLLSVAGREKAKNVMEQFITLSIKDRLDPNSPAWGKVLEALGVKRGFFPSSSCRAFKKAIQKAKNEFKTHLETDQPKSDADTKGLQH